MKNSSNHPANFILLLGHKKVHLRTKKKLINKQHSILNRKLLYTIVAINDIDFLNTAVCMNKNISDKI